MQIPSHIHATLGFLVVGIASAVAPPTLGQVPDKAKVVAGAERAFEKAAKTNPMPAPGCGVGVSLNGESVFEKAFGMAEMEHNIPNTAQTIFESGSVAKQFTAAALVLLQQDGKLKIDDDVRKYVPELPEYGKPITIRHILTHTSGLRDWGAVMSLTGAGRGDRVITQDIAFDVVIRQKALDFKPGAEYSYSNSGYQLATIIIERVSKQKFADFVAERLFKPLGMKNSSWRDDYRRLVPGRAQAYTRQGATGGWRLNMPFMNVVGNGGMLTTIGDWLKWNAMLDSRSFNPKLVDELETQAVLNDGLKINYALGMDVTAYKGIKRISHQGETAGYRTFLARYPEKKLSVALLCNGSPPFAVDIVDDLVDEILGPFPAGLDESDYALMTAETLQKYVGVWRDERTRAPVRFTVENGILTLNGARLRPVAEGAFAYDSSRVEFTVDKAGRLVGREVDGNGLVHAFFREPQWVPTAAELSSLAGEWYSDEAQAKFTFAIEGDKAYIVIKPNLRLPLQPVYKDHFAASDYVAWFTRDRAGKIDNLHVGAWRMRDIAFERVSR